MSIYSLSHLADRTLLHDLAALVAREQTTTAELLPHLAEVDERRLYLSEAYPSMYMYCVQALHLSEDSACNQIRAARTARQFPTIFSAVAEGRLHLSAVVQLAPHLSPENVEELLKAAAHKSKAEIDRIIAERFPRPELPASVQPISPTPSIASLALRPVEQSAPGRIETAEPRPRVAPLTPQRFGLQFTFGQSAHDKLRYAQELLSHQVRPGDIAAVFERALDALIPQLEKQKFAATAKPRRSQACPKPGDRYVPTGVKRAVWRRDGGRCTFVSDTGLRCPARTLLEYDHSVEVARGGEATVEGIRLRCRAHNQFTAERTFGVDFMRDKRQAAQRTAEERRARAEIQEHTRDVMAGLRELGVRADKARRAAEYSATLPVATLEERMRAALKFICPSPGRTAIQAVATS